MDSVFTMLKQAREAKNLSLADVSDTTFISIRFLEAIEAGKTDILPQAYVRAFIREYAAVVGLDIAEVMRRYDSMGRPQAPPAAAPLRTKPQAVGQPTSAPSSPPPPEPALETPEAPLPEAPPPQEPSVARE